MLVSQIQPNFTELPITVRSRASTAFWLISVMALRAALELVCAHRADKRGAGTKGGHLSCSAGTELQGNVLWELFPFITHLQIYKCSCKGEGGWVQKAAGAVTGSFPHEEG